MEDRKQGIHSGRTRNRRVLPLSLGALAAALLLGGTEQADPPQIPASSPDPLTGRDRT